MLWRPTSKELTPSHAPAPPIPSVKSTSELNPQKDEQAGGQGVPRAEVGSFLWQESAAPTMNPPPSTAILSRSPPRVGRRPWPLGPTHVPFGSNSSEPLACPSLLLGSSKKQESQTLGTDTWLGTQARGDGAGRWRGEVRGGPERSEQAESPNKTDLFHLPPSVHPWLGQEGWKLGLRGHRHGKAPLGPYIFPPVRLESLPGK